MNLHHLRIFKAVADAGNMTAASDELLISQSAVSTQLKQLERQLAAVLFTRQPRGMELTQAGVVLADYAQRIFALADDAASAIRDLHSLRRGSLRIGASPTIGVYFLPQLLVHFQRRFPHIELEVEIEENQLIEQRLRDGFLEIGFSPVVPAFADLRSKPFMQDEFVAVAARTNPLVKQRKISAAQLSVAFILRRVPSATGALALGYFARHNITCRPALTLGSVEAVKQAVIAGLGVTIISKMAVASELKSNRLMVLKSDGLPIQRSLFQLQRNAPESKAATAFGCLLKHAVRGKLPAISSRGS